MDCLSVGREMSQRGEEKCSARVVIHLVLCYGMELLS